LTLVFVTGTSTGVGKTIATAALACHARLAGIDVTVCKPVQTGSADGDDDLAEVFRLAGIAELVSGWRYPEPLAPAAAASLANLPLPSRAELGDLMANADGSGRLTLVEGAGGLLVEIGAGGVTLRDLAADLAAPVLVVAAAGLGTLNHTALTVEALAAERISCIGVIVGAWPERPGPAESYNRGELARLAPLRALLPEKAAALTPGEFEAISQAAFDTAWVRDLLR
jgi:dethiobiotin synthetase